MDNLLPLFRRTKSIRQRELAKALDVSPSYLCKVEKGLVLPTESFMKSCSVFLDEPVDRLFPGLNTSRRHSDLNAALSNNLWSVRQRKEIKQNRLAEMLGCSPSYLSKVENGSQCPSDLFKRKCARLLKTKVSELFPETPPVVV